MSNIRQFKSRKDKFDDWWKEVIEINDFVENPPEKCVFMYTDKAGKSYMLYYQCDNDDICDYANDFRRVALERSFDTYLRNHISDYLEYV